MEGYWTWLRLILSIVVGFGVMPSAAGAVETVGFRMTVEDRGTEVELAVHAEGVNDLYAFDLQLKIDPERLRLKAATSEIQGFAVGPLLEGDLITFAHTKTGSSRGSNGEATLAVLIFERIGGEGTVVQLIRAQLVNSKLDMTEYAPEARIGIKRSALWSDVVGHWAEAFIREAMESAVVDGYPDGTFRPDQTLTRVEFAAMLVRLLQLPTIDSPEPAFSDKSDIAAWARPYVAKAVQGGLIVGYEDGTFRANRPIRREEIAAIIVRALEGTAGATGSSAYADDNLISDWARPYVAAVSSSGMMNGRSGNLFAPRAALTRAEAVTILMRMKRSADYPPA